MKKLILAIEAEFLKNIKSKVIWITFIAFSLAPIMGGVFMFLLKNPETLAESSGIALKAKAMNLEVNWYTMLSVLTQAVGVGGIILFGFVISWIFGREYSEGTAKDLLALPISRTIQIQAKFFVYICWSIGLVLSNLVIGCLIALLLDLPSSGTDWIPLFLYDYMITTILTILVGFPIALFAIWGRGYLAPLGFVALTLVFSQVIAATGYGSYFPWAIPGLYSGAGGIYKMLLNEISYIIVILTAIAGYFGTVWYWNSADHAK
jgi:ABC-type transport system involved in multi-copper enzyme maturation permease subunit